MSEKLKSFIFWASAILIFVVIIITFVIPLVALLIYALFLPNLDTTSLREFSQNVSSFLGFVSVVLAVFSVWQANKGNQDFKKVVAELQDLRESQTELITYVKSKSEVTEGTANKYNWQQDKSK